MATEWSSLIPESVARDVIAAAADESAVLALGNVVVMPSGVTNVPVVSVAPSAVFVATGARKPTSTIEWTAETLQPEEIALTLYIPDAYLDDAGFPVWESVRTEVAKAIGKTLDGAVLYGVGAPASYPAGGIAALAGAAQSGTDALEAIDAAATAIEATGLVPNGIVAGAAIGSALRAAYREVGALPSTVPEQTIYGMPVAAGLGKVTPKDLRASFCSLAGRRHVDPVEAAQLTGHSLAVWARHYARSFGKAQRDEARARLLEHGFGAVEDAVDDVEAEVR